MIPHDGGCTALDWHPKENVLAFIYSPKDRHQRASLGLLSVSPNLLS